MALALSLAGCNDTAADEDFQGELIATFPFEIANAGMGRQLDVPVEVPEGLRIALFWQVGGLRGRPDDVIEHPSTGIEPTGRENVITLREPPPSEALVDGAWAIARVVAYLDADGDDRKGPDEGVYSDLEASVLLFALRDLDAAASPTGAPLAAGLHRQRLPIVCDPATLPTPTPGECAVPFGTECVADETDCGRGVCFELRSGGPTPSFSCALPIEDAGDCHPADAGFRALWDGDPNRVTGQYLQRCAADQDCL
ncbi:MAG: hypothetical protein KC620_16410, partial [Myxococcales bacterium]|nr:hypothetical protein [Myxococcales bacterium]